MKVVKVVPIARAIKKDNLHYFTADNVKVGDFLEAPLRSNTIIAKVLEVVDPKNLKTELKSSSFSLKKAKKLQTGFGLSNAFIEAGEETAKYFASSLGSILQSVLPPKLLFNDLIKINPAPKTEKKNILADTMVFQAPYFDRMSVYKSLIREKFAQNKSIFFVLPSGPLVKSFYEKIKIGLEAYTFFFCSGSKKTELINNWKQAIKEKHPVIIIATPNFLFMPRNDFGVFVVEEEASRFYKKEQRPFTDFRVFIENFSKKSGIDLIFADSMIRSELVSKLNNHQISEYRKSSFRILFDNQAKLAVFPNKEKKDNFEFGLSKELLDLVEYNFYHKEKLFIFVPRRGLSPITFCRDCFSAQKCSKCNSYLVLHEGINKKPENRLFKCHSCGLEKSVKSRCGVCNSWNLKAIYSGVDGVVKTLEKSFEDLVVFKNSADNKKINKSQLESFLKTKGGVLVGTEATLNFLDQIDNVAVLSSEILFSVPEYSVAESAVRLLMKLRFLAKSKFLIQNPEKNNGFLLPIASGNLLDFYNTELQQREVLKYPPFTVLISIDVPENKKNLKKVEDLKKELKKYKIAEFQKKIGRKKIVSLLMRAEAENYPDNKLTEILKNLPLDFNVEVNPYTLFR